jgi:hypothetical protein
MNRYIIVLISFFLLKIFYDPTVNILIKHLYLETSRKVSSVSYIIIR